jgi:hypothetical protein
MVCTVGHPAADAKPKLRTWLNSVVVDVEPVGRRSARTAVRLEYATSGWNAIEAAVAVGSGIVAGSVALVGFGLDSAIEVVGATVVLVHLRAVLAGAEPNVAWQRQALRTHRSHVLRTSWLPDGGSHRHPCQG